MAEPIKYVEFYSGIGGWSHALKKIIGEDRTQVVGAYDHSTICNEVYKYNLNFNPSQKPIESLTPKLLDGIADLWMMSPPCQPYTRQRNELENQLKDDDDPRAKSFLHLCSMLSLLNKPPSIIILENVVGFECSDCCRTWLKSLIENGYSFEHFHLTPSQFNYPNERPRYYLIAKKNNNNKFVNSNVVREDIVAKSQSFSSSDSASVEVNDNHDKATIDIPISHFQCDEVDIRRTVKDFLEMPDGYIKTLGGGGESGAGGGGGGGGGSSMDQNPSSSTSSSLPDWLQPLAIDDKVMNKDASWCFDIVKGSDSNTAW